MTYVQGFLIPVKEGDKQRYLDLATKAAPVFADYGALGTVECWGDDVPDGKRTDMKRAVKAEPDEKIVFSWVWWPDKATCDAAAEKLMADERMQPDGELPFNPQRMIYGGYEPAYEGGDGGKFGFVDGIVAPTASDKAVFVDHARTISAYFLKKGATRIVDGWGVDVPDGKVTDFKRAVAAEEGETVIFGWVEWPDKPTRDAAFAGMMDDPDIQAAPPAFDMQRAIFGGFVPMFDTDHQ